MSAAEHATDHWDHKDEWRRHGKDFLIVVSRHNGTAEPYGKGPNRWAVYAYIYPKHLHFAAFNGPHMWQEATGVMPLHGGASLLEYPMYEGKVTSVKVGADYDHLHDERFSHLGTMEEAYEVFGDAEELFAWLQARGQTAATGAQS